MFKLEFPWKLEISQCQVIFSTDQSFPYNFCIGKVYSNFVHFKLCYISFCSYFESSIYSEIILYIYIFYMYNIYTHMTYVCIVALLLYSIYFVYIKNFLTFASFIFINFLNFF